MYVYVCVCVCVCEILIPVVYLTLLAWGHIVVEWGGPGHLIVLGQPTSTHTNTHTHTHTHPYTHTHTHIQTFARLRIWAIFSPP